jgi:hypothetical protein
MPAVWKRIQAGKRETGNLGVRTIGKRLGHGGGNDATDLVAEIAKTKIPVVKLVVIHLDN